MKVIAVSHQKGGVGKTSLTVNLALCYAQDLKVAVIDIDLQGSLQSISKLITGVDILDPSLYQGSNIKKILNLDYDLILIDTPPYLTDNLKAIFDISDYVLVPSKVSYVDIMAVRATIAMVKDTLKTNPNLKSGLVLNMVKSGSTINDEIGELIQDLDIKLLESTIGDRVSFTRSLILNGIFQTEDSKAKEEILNLAHEILLEMRG